MRSVIKSSWVRIFAVLFGLILIYQVFICSDCLNSVYHFFINLFIQLILFAVFWLGNELIANFLNRKISWVKYPHRRLIAGILGMVGYTLLAGTIVAYVMFVEVFDSTWDDFVNKHLPDFLQISMTITFFIALVVHNYAFFKHWKIAAQQAEELKRQQLLSQYNSLKEQLNPHFLFNSLNSLSALVHKDPDKAVKFIKQLSMIYRYVLEHAKKEVVPLAEELSFLQSYIYLLKIRHGDNLFINGELESVGNYYIPPLSMQMLIENVIKHNIVSSSQPMTIDIELQKDGYIEVSNKLQLKRQNIQSTGVGLDNIRSRYKVLSEKEVTVKENEDTFTVKLPLLSFSNTHESTHH